MTRIQISLLIFIVSFLVMLGLSFASAFLSFTEDPLGGERIQKVSYPVFLFFRFPSHYILSLHDWWPKIHHQLMMGSLFYSLLVSGLTFPFIRKKSDRQSLV